MEPTSSSVPHQNRFCSETERHSPILDITKNKTPIPPPCKLNNPIHNIWFEDIQQPNSNLVISMSSKTPGEATVDIIRASSDHERHTVQTIGLEGDEFWRFPAGVYYVAPDTVCNDGSTKATICHMLDLDQPPKIVWAPPDSVVEVPTKSLPSLRGRHIQELLDPTEIIRLDPSECFHLNPEATTGPEVYLRRPDNSQGHLEVRPSCLRLKRQTRANTKPEVRYSDLYDDDTVLCTGRPELVEDGTYVPGVFELPPRTGCRVVDGKFVELECGVECWLNSTAGRVFYYGSRTKGTEKSDSK
jgi:hypothetical protein